MLDFALRYTIYEVDVIANHEILIRCRGLLGGPASLPWHAVLAH